MMMTHSTNFSDNQRVIRYEDYIHGATEKPRAHSHHHTQNYSSLTNAWRDPGLERAYNRAQNRALKQYAWRKLLVVTNCMIFEAMESVLSCVL